MLKTVQIVFILIILLCCGCSYYFMEPPLDPSLEAILPKSIDPEGWAINPAKDRIGYKAYSDPKTELAFLLLPATKQTYPLPCFSYWLSNDDFYCYYEAQAYQVDPTTFAASLIPFETHTMTTTNLSQQLAQAQEIYAIPLTSDKKIWLKTPDTYLLISQVTDFTTTLKGYTYTVVTNGYGPHDTYNQKIYSPDQNYYYSTTSPVNYELLGIYEATTDKLIASYQTSSSCVGIDGTDWAADSSGVYFSTSSGCFVSFATYDGRNFVYKLKVPKP